MNSKNTADLPMRFDHRFNPTQYHSITDVGFSGPDGLPDATDDTFAIRTLERAVAKIEGVREINNQLEKRRAYELSIAPQRLNRV